MNNSSFRNLAIVVFALIVILVGVEMSDRDNTVVGGGPLFPELRGRINSVTELQIELPGEPAITLRSASDGWTVANRSGYPANIGKIREVLLAFADAQIVEEKTSNAERYAALGVTQPDEDESRGIRVTITGEEFENQMIVGDVYQGSGRYLRRTDRDAAVLVDKNPELPDAVGEWLRPELVDVETNDVSQVNIRHRDGETIELARPSESDVEFEVLDIPDGRELSYPTVANGIAAVLSNLTLVDVRPAASGEVETTSRFETTSGLRLTLRTYAAGDDRWISIHAAANEPADGESGDEGEAAADASVRAMAINDRLQGWEFRIDSYKLEQLTRRWADILKADDD